MFMGNSLPAGRTMRKPAFFIALIISQKNLQTALFAYDRKPHKKYFPKFSKTALAWRRYVHYIDLVLMTRQEKETTMTSNKLIAKLQDAAWDMGFSGRVTIEDGVVIMILSVYAVDDRRVWLGLAKSGLKILRAEMGKIG